MGAADACLLNHCNDPNQVLPLNLVQGVDWVARHGHCDRHLELFLYPCLFLREFGEVSFCYPRLGPHLPEVNIGNCLCSWGRSWVLAHYPAAGWMVV